MRALRSTTAAFVIVGVTLISACADPNSAEPGGVAPGVAEVGDWTKVPDSPLSPRREVISGWLSEHFVVVGGWDDAPCPPSADCIAPELPALRDGAAFDPAAGRWESIAPAPVPVSRKVGCG